MDALDFFFCFNLASVRHTVMLLPDEPDDDDDIVTVAVNININDNNNNIMLMYTQTHTQDILSNKNWQ